MLGGKSERGSLKGEASMANDLLTSFKTASRQYGHIVFNDRTQEFERAGKRHAIATFFGTADAKAKNNLTLCKLKEALAAEVQEGGRFYGIGKDTDSLFASVKSSGRMSSRVLMSIVDNYRREAKSAFVELKQLKKEVSSGIMHSDSGRPMDVIGLLVKGMEGYSDGIAGRRIIDTMVERLLDINLEGKTVEAAIGELKNSAGDSELTGKVKAGMMYFINVVGMNEPARNAFVGIFALAAEMKSERFSQMAGCELANILVSHYLSPHSINPADDLAQLLDDLKNRDSVQNLAVGMESLPLDGESYGIVRDFCTWEDERKVQCLDLLERQSAGNRIPLLAAMKASGSSRDVVLLQKLVDSQDKIVKLHKYGNRLNPESISRAIEAGSSQIHEAEDAKID